MDFHEAQVRGVWRDHGKNKCQSVRMHELWFGTASKEIETIYSTFFFGLRSFKKSN